LHTHKGNMLRIGSTVVGYAATAASVGAVYNAHAFAQKEDIALTAVPFLEAVGPYRKALLQLTGGKAKPKQVPMRQAVEIVESFQARDFDCADGYLGIQRNGHWQTIVGTGALQKALTGKEPERQIETISERFATPDGDYFDVDFSKAHFGPEAAGTEQEELPMVIILHGLEANYRGGMVTKMAEEYLAQGFAPVFYSFRGCGGTPNLTVGGYHVGFTKDINQLSVDLHRRYPNRKIYLSGFSLGGNVSLKYLGELGNKAADRHIFGAVTMSVPYDAVGAGAAIDDGINKYIYAANFLKTLKAKAEVQNKSFPGTFDIEAVRAAKTIGDFDNAFIAAIYKYKDQFDYYLQNGSKAWVHKIRVPVVSINAKDDPFIPEKTLPDPVADVGEAPVRLIYTKHGGHCGFVASARTRQAAEVVDTTTLVPDKGAILATKAKKTTSSGNDDRWIAVEMARALKHIHTESERITNA